MLAQARSVERSLAKKPNWRFAKAHGRSRDPKAPTAALPTGAARLPRVGRAQARRYDSALSEVAQ